MNKKVWTFQIKKEVEEKGPQKASWYVGWYDLVGKRHSESCGSGARGKNQAEKRLRRIQGELDLGVHQPQNKKTWEDFRDKYEAEILPGHAPRTQPLIKAALDNFERIIQPKKMDGITTSTVDTFIAKRRKEAGKKKGSFTSPATINKDLRHLKAALRHARKWKYLLEVPEFIFVREPEKQPLFVTPEHFEVIYHKACPLANLPSKCEPHYSAKEWWQALVVTAYMTGLRIHELLSIKKPDLDLSVGKFTTRWFDNKGKRDETIPLHPLVVDHLRKIIGKSELVFHWAHDYRTLWQEFGRIQRGAGIQLHCPEQHEHTPACFVYTFHDFRRAFATVNAPRLKPEVLQRLMRHQSYQTTLGYVNLTNQLDEAIKLMPVPKALREANADKKGEDEKKVEQTNDEPG
jgi:integrase